MSLFMVMKKYDMSLADYLDTHKEQMSSRTSLILLTQLLEGISHLASCGVAHRDIKCDNLLLSLSGGPQFPQLVITDFGCCYADKSNRLRLPYRTWDTDKGGNAALMAPEVAMARPGTFTNINYYRFSSFHFHMELLITQQSSSDLTSGQQGHLLIRYLGLRTHSMLP